MSERKSKGFELFYNELMKDRVFSPTNRFEQQWLYRQAKDATGRHRDLKIVELGTLNCTAALIISEGVLDKREDRIADDIDVTATVWTIDSYLGRERMKPGANIRSHKRT